MKKILLTVALLGVALATTASAHPGGCYPHPVCYGPSYCEPVVYYPCHPHHHHIHVVLVP